MMKRGEWKTWERTDPRHFDGKTPREVYRNAYQYARQYGGTRPEGLISPLKQRVISKALTSFLTSDTDMTDTFHLRPMMIWINMDNIDVHTYLEREKDCLYSADVSVFDGYKRVLQFNISHTPYPELVHRVKSAVAYLHSLQGALPLDRIEAKQSVR